MSADEHDATMRFSPGSIVFSVQGVLFRVSTYRQCLPKPFLTKIHLQRHCGTQIPKALLQQHSEAFSSMLDVSDSRGDKIVLQDSLEAFRDFRAMLFTYAVPKLLFLSFDRKLGILLDHWNPV